MFALVWPAVLRISSASEVEDLQRKAELKNHKWTATKTTCCKFQICSQTPSTILAADKVDFSEQGPLCACFPYAPAIWDGELQTYTCCRSAPVHAITIRFKYPSMELLTLAKIIDPA